MVLSLGKACKLLQEAYPPSGKRSDGAFVLVPSNEGVVAAA
jgi:hypothetical protein